MLDYCSFTSLCKKSIVIFGYMWTQTKLTQQFYTVLNVLRFISCQVVNGQDQSFAMNPLGPLNTLRRTQNLVYSATLKFSLLSLKLHKSSKECTPSRPISRLWMYFFGHLFYCENVTEFADEITADVKLQVHFPIVLLIFFSKHLT